MLIKNFKMKEINANYTKKQDLLRQQEQFFLFLLSGVYGEFGAKIMEIKVAKTNAPLNYRN